MALIIFLAGVGGVLIIVVSVIVSRRQRRRQVREQSFPEAWLSVIKRNVRVYKRLPAPLREKLKDLVKVFMDEKSFEGCGGLELTEEIKVTIAAEACVLLLNRHPNYFYRKLSTILVYPTAYFAEGGTMIGGQYARSETARAGESWHDGVVVLAWDHVKNDSTHDHDGHNVVFHEFAHQLDQEQGPSNGTPFLERRDSYGAWAEILGKEFEELRRDIKQHHKDIIDAYGATNPAEFFAVVTETFFEQPNNLKDAHPELYEELKTCYELDPAEWDARTQV